MFLILGGTTEASDLARRLAARPGVPVLMSLAGRTSRPAMPPVPVRIGGFGGAEGLAAFIRHTGIRAVVDATHPFAARMSANADEACRATGVPLLALRRPPWTPVAGDRWTDVADAGAAADALGVASRRVFLTVGRLELPPFLDRPQHFYLVRTVDAPDRLPPDATLILARGPFAEVDERNLIEEARIDVVVTKNSGGTATHGKIAAARSLGLPVILIRRPALPDATTVGTAGEAMDWIEAEYRNHQDCSQLRGE